MMYPKVQKYCLMSVKGCWTDFHIGKFQIQKLYQKVGVIFKVRNGKPNRGT